ncbi:MAG: hypothetical protein AAF567_00430 [Actinomycetota bacterium]
MSAALHDRRFLTYLVATNVLLVALAAIGATWFMTGLGTLVLAEVATTLRTELATRRATAPST